MNVIDIENGSAGYLIIYFQLTFWLLISVLNDLRTRVSFPIGYRL